VRGLASTIPPTRYSFGRNATRPIVSDPDHDVRWFEIARPWQRSGTGQRRGRIGVVIERGAQTQWGILGSDEEVEQPALEDDLFDEDESEDEEAGESEDEAASDGPAAARG